MHPCVSTALANDNVRVEMEMFCNVFDQINPLALVLKRLSRETHANANVVMRHEANHQCVCAFITNATDMQSTRRQLAVWLHDSPQERGIDICSAMMEPLQYPVLYPTANLGWGKDGANFTLQSTRGNYMTQIEYYSNLIMKDLHWNPTCNRYEPLRFGRFGMLYNEWLVDMYSRTEDERLNTIRSEGIQSRMAKRVDIQSNLNSQPTLQRLGKSILGSSFPGSSRHKKQELADAWALVDYFGRASLFITMTCNPNWDEIKNNLLPAQQAVDNPALCARVFKMKFYKLKNRLRELWGPQVYSLHVIEFQRGGLPHAHMVVKFPHPVDNPTDIDHYVHCTMSHPTAQPNLYAKVMKHMYHSDDHKKCKKDANGKCYYKYPKDLNHMTHVLESGYVNYKRPCEHSRRVTPTNYTLLEEFDCHINVEVSYTVNVLKYLFKYLYKGTSGNREWAKLNNQNDNDVDEISEYISHRVLSAAEASWRILGFHMKRQDPAVTCLKVHLEGQDNVTFDANDGLENIEKSLCGQSSLVRYFNRPWGLWDSQTYVGYYTDNILYSSIKQIPVHASSTAWQDNTDFPRPPWWQFGMPQLLHTHTHLGIKRQWVVPRDGVNKHLARLQLLMPNNGDVYYLRALLKYFPARSFDELYFVNGIKHPSYQAAAIARGLFDTHNEATMCFIEACSVCYTPKTLRALYVVCLIEGANGLELLTDHGSEMLEGNGGNYDERWNNMLLDVQSRLEQLNRSMGDFNLPTPHGRRSLVEKYWDNNKKTHAAEQWQAMKDSIDTNAEQLHAMDAIDNALEHSLQNAPSATGNMLFINGRSGCGKTWLANYAIASTNKLGHITVACAPTGLAALNFENGNTAHYTFNLPVVDNYGGATEAIESNLDASADRAELLRECKLILWDEACNQSVQCIKAASDAVCTLCNIDKNTPFAGKCVIFLGDFRQIPPVVVSNSKQDVINDSIVSWSKFTAIEQLPLVESQRDKHDPIYASWVLSLGNGTCQTERITMDRPVANTSTMQTTQYDKMTPIPDFVKATESTNEAISTTFPNLNDPQGCSKCAILCTSNLEVDHINSTILDQMDNGQLTEELEGVTCLATEVRQAAQFLQCEDHLENINKPGVPPHRLYLKVGSICFVMRNLSRENKMMNGSKVLITKIVGNYQIWATHLETNEEFIFPRIQFKFGDIGATILRKQFPLRLCYAMTKNKSQGQTLQKVAVCEHRLAFAHGQSYVSYGRVCNATSMLVLLSDNHPQIDHVKHIRNIVWKELLDHAR
jgi:hypothetical protein